MLWVGEQQERKGLSSWKESGLWKPTKRRKLMLLTSRKVQKFNLGARWSCFLAVTLMMVWLLIYGWYIQRSQIRVQAGHAFWWLLLRWFEWCYKGPTYRGPKSGCKLVTLFGGYSYDGNSAIRVQHTEVPNLGASWSRFLAVTIMMVWLLL